MKQIILGTAGHIDHGKTSLIRSLTGIETDRLKEEKTRGITIELGFASMDLPNGQHVGIVDVPGHEKFVKNMVAGATGIDIVAMVIAADEGVMPQTREHMEICSLLGISHGVVVLTKTDLVDEEWLELVQEDIGGFLEGTFLEGAPMIPVSSITGEGMDTLKATLAELSTTVPQRRTSSLFRLPVDRVFTMKGFGTVITGSVISGQISVGDAVTIYPSGTESKVRGIQVHSDSVETAASGMRTAINFQGLEKSAIQRGEVVSTPGDIKPSYLMDVEFLYLPSAKKPLKNRTRIRLHTGTSEVLGYLILLDRESLDAGDTAAVQLRLEEPVACIKDDRYVIRSYSPVRTIGGGRILNPIPPKHKRFRDDVVKGLAGLMENELPEIIAFHVIQSGYAGLPFSDLKLMTNCSEKQLTGALSGLLSKRMVIQTDKETRTLIHGDTFNRLTDIAKEYLAEYHKANPLKEGMSKEELKSKFPDVLGSRVFTLTLNHLVSENAVILTADTVKLATHTVELQVDQEQLKKDIINAYSDTALTPPYFKALCESLGVPVDKAKDVLLLLIKEGVLMKVKEDLYFHQPALEGLKSRVLAFFESNTEMSTADFKEMTGGVSRKYLIPLLEHYDGMNLTIRVGDARQLRGRS
ncbi:selenocysteine-specific translation elongation factor [Desulfoluna spongiiphila]|uniref:Selenocysteine-specific elongation factor n=1 Tax=Desulfoluna spongiiphila TaxID=419481 RepID=A0A1G5C0A8_9BACT|nr:selenocysteine-specific translation elongation factor [Desulfoluna spongiiphila]SCX95821.1 selenocysteine-specific translation elongation factor SelB [Desulfoluna spongiiphila]VVS94026.1 translation elongation factor selenocysteine-specific [Desulfoluna spongiiphila]